MKTEDPTRCRFCNTAKGSAYDARRHEELAHREELEALKANKWTPEEDERLKAVAHKGSKYAAEVLGRTEPSVVGHAHKLGISLQVREPETAPEPPEESVVNPEAQAHASVEEGREAFAAAAQEEYDAEEARRRAIADCSKYPCGQPAAPGICGMCTDRVAITQEAPKAVSVPISVDLRMRVNEPDYRMEAIKAYAMAARAFMHSGGLDVLQAHLALERIEELSS